MLYLVVLFVLAAAILIVYAIRYIVIAGRRAKVALQRDPESHTVQIGDPPTLAGVAREVTDRMFVRHDPHNPSGAFPPRQPRSFPTSEGRVVRIEEVDGELPSYHDGTTSATTPVSPISPPPVAYTSTISAGRETRGMELPMYYEAPPKYHQEPVVRAS